MKKGTHPAVHKVKIKCACGNVIDTISTAKEGYTVEICSNCHPFFTGKQKIIDSAGKIEKFRKKYAKLAKGA